MKAVALTVGVLCLIVVAVTASRGFGECGNSFAASFIPAEPTNTARVCRDRRIAIAYDIDMTNPAWSAYYVTPEDVDDNIPGRDSFFEDPDLEEAGVKQAPVKSCAFSQEWNRGHLAPSRIMSNTDDSKRATYTMANVAPQGGYFNQHPWQTLETRIFEWIGERNPLHLVTGVAYKDRSQPTSSGCDNIAIPDYYWKVICDPTTGQAAGFYGSNDQSKSYDCLRYNTVEKIEKLYGGPILPSTVCKKNWYNATYWWGYEKKDSVPAIRRMRKETP